MKNVYKYGFLILIMTFLSACAANQLASSTGFKPVYTLDGVAIGGYDSVGYFTDNKPIKGNAAISTTYLGEVWHFASEQNKQTFLSNPEKYAPQYGGFCAYAITNDIKAKSIPEAFTIVNDKLYLNLSLPIRKKWQANVAEYIVEGDENWKNH